MKKRYGGSTHLAKLIAEYIEKRQTNQSQLARAIGSSQPAISHLTRGSRHADRSEPYFGLKADGEMDPVLVRVVEHLRIPWRRVEAALQEDQLEWAVEKLRRTTEAIRANRATVTASRKQKRCSPYRPNVLHLRAPSPRHHERKRA